MSNARAYRIDQYLNDLIHVQNKKIDASDMKEMLADVYDAYAAIKCPLMVKIVSRPGLLERYINDTKILSQTKKWIASLKRWDYKFDVDSVDATIFMLWEYYFTDGMFQNQILDRKIRNHRETFSSNQHFMMNTLKELIKEPNYLSQYCQTDIKNETNACVGLLSKSFISIYNYLVKEGSNYDHMSARYGNYHKVEYTHSPFSSTALKFLFHRTDEDSGSKNTINVGNPFFAEFESNGINSFQTPNYRMIVDFGNDSDNYYSLETGDSESILLNFYYFNLHESHFNFEMIPMGFNQLNTTTNKRWSTMRFIYKKWYAEREAELAELEKQKITDKKEDL